MARVKERIIKKLIEDGYPEDMILRYVDALKKNYANEEEIIECLKDREIPENLKNNKKAYKIFIDSLKHAIAIEEGMEVYPRLDPMKNLE